MRVSFLCNPNELLDLDSDYRYQLCKKRARYYVPPDGSIHAIFEVVLPSATQIEPVSDQAFNKTIHVQEMWMVEEYVK